MPRPASVEFVLAQPVTHDELVLALNRRGDAGREVSGLSVIGTEPHPREFRPILGALSPRRLEPGRWARRRLP